MARKTVFGLNCLVKPRFVSAQRFLQEGPGDYYHHKEGGVLTALITIALTTRHGNAELYLDCEDRLREARLDILSAVPVTRAMKLGHLDARLEKMVKKHGEDLGTLATCLDRKKQRPFVIWFRKSWQCFAQSEPMGWCPACHINRLSRSATLLNLSSCGAIQIAICKACRSLLKIERLHCDSQLRPYQGQCHYYSLNTPIESSYNKSDSFVSCSWRQAGFAMFTPDFRIITNDVNSTLLPRRRVTIRWSLLGELVPLRSET